ncbi:MAG: Ppx/GppA phosphatase family protein [Pseudomonadota bacterium]
MSSDESDYSADTYANESAGSSTPGERGAGKRSHDQRRRERYAALDLGTNNCRLLIAAPRGRGFRVIDAFSRIVRLGEGLSTTGALDEAAMERAISAIAECADKIERRGATHIKCIATQACRTARNGDAFLATVKERTGLEFEIITPEEEARLAVSGCRELIDEEAKAALIFDIGGGSTELSWLQKRGDAFELAAWMSMPIGVVSLSEKWNGRDLTADAYSAAVREAREALSAFSDADHLKADFVAGDAHLLGTSGTVTSIAGVHLKLPRYRRDKVDGIWLDITDAKEVSDQLRAMSFEARADEPCIGRERADLVVCGCAILEAIVEVWPTQRIRVADRGLREGLLADLARDARRARRRRRRRKKNRKAKSD